MAGKDDAPEYTSATRQTKHPMPESQRLAVPTEIQCQLTVEYSDHGTILTRRYRNGQAALLAAACHIFSWIKRFNQIQTLLRTRFYHVSGIHIRSHQSLQAVTLRLHSAGRVALGNRTLKRSCGMLATIQQQRIEIQQLTTSGLLGDTDFSRQVD